MRKPFTWTERSDEPRTVCNGTKRPNFPDSISRLLAVKVATLWPELIDNQNVVDRVVHLLKQIRGHTCDTPADLQGSANDANTAYARGMQLASDQRQCKCGCVYEIREHHSPMRDKDSLTCEHCGHAYLSWNGGRWYSEVKRVSGPPAPVEAPADAAEADDEAGGRGNENENEERGCKECRDSKIDLVQVGEPEDHKFGKAEGRETRYMCSVCGGKWVYYQDWGLGGSNKSWGWEG